MVIMDVKNIVAIVTGGASGLGEACVRNLIKEGARVSILDLAEEHVKKFAPKWEMLYFLFD
jgi:NAD(P)-dependent dehydrogenase (short-subunit alcohol dehydrogenase family)